MRSSASSHRLSYRTRERSTSGRPECFTLDCKLILNLLCALLDENSHEAESSATAGQKRPRPLSHTISRKRRNLGTEQIGISCPPDESIPVLRHEFNLQYFKGCPDVRPYSHLISDNEAEEYDLTSLEHALVIFLRDSCASPTEPTTLDCGDVLINNHGEYGGTADAKPLHLEGQWANLRSIFVVPPLYVEGMETWGGHLFSWVDSLTRSHVYQSAVELKACLRMIVSPLTSWDETLHTLPFCLVLDVVLSFRPPAIFQPFANALNGRNRIEIEKARRGLLHLAFPPPLPETFSSFKGRINVPFLYAVLQPARAVLHESVDKLLQPQGLLPRLLPFQRRTVCWMLEREGKGFGPSGELIPVVADPAELPVLWRRVTVHRDNEQLTWYYHRLTGTLTSDLPDPRTVQGGILAEEPGLGKTLECLALILLNPSIGRSLSHAWWDSEARMTIREIRTTLIVTPSPLSQQWIDELTRHTPSLKVLVYPGWKTVFVEGKLKKKTTSRREKNGKVKAADVIDSDDANVSLLDSWPAYIDEFDVCVTTYDILRQDLNVARAAPARPTRQTVEYSRDKRPISPLVICEWYRVIMDEVQMVGGGKASEMVSLIPRLSSFAVSGTPARTRVSDLSYVLKFLRVDPAIYAPRNWSSLVHPSYATEFTTIFRKYTVRTMKSAVQAELTIPVQTRYVLPIHLGKVERHIYDENMEKALNQLGLDVRGMATSQNGEVNTALLRTWLRKLRQICTHPQVGQLQKSGDRSYRSGVLKTMRQVLEGMQDQNWRNVMDDRRSKINEMVTATQMLQHDAGLDQRPQNCLEILLQAEKEADEAISDVLSAITDHDVKGVELKVQAASLRAVRGKRHVVDPDPDPDPAFDNDDDDDGELPKTPAGEEHLHKSRALQQRMRDCYLLLHRVKFLQGDIYHWIGESKVTEESAAYKAADEIRSKLLKFTEESAMRAMAQLRTDVGKKRLVEKDILVRMPYCPRGGILSAYLLEEADKLIDQVLNAQSRLLWKWRMCIYSLLTQSLTASNNEGEADGQEYSRTLNTQGEAEAYLQAYATLLADRREVLSAERTVLAVHNARERKHRKTAVAVRAIAPQLDELDLGLVTDDIELQPEHEVLKKELMDARKTLSMNFVGRAVKSIMVDLIAVSAKIPKDDDPEKVLAKEGASGLRRLMSAQAIINEQIEADLALFRKAFNERILYFRQLQEISDSVGEAHWDDVDVGLALRRNRAAQTELERRIITGRARQRYLAHLSEEQDIGQGEANECCILCRDEFLSGYITQCAHVFCESCMKTWLLRHGKACPVCRFPINVDGLQRFSIQRKDKDKGVQSPEKLQGDAIPKSRRKIEYNTIGSSLLAEIDTMEVCGSYGTKIDTLVRHLLYLQLADAGAKSIVFSAWEDSLHIIEHALTRNGIPSIRIDSGNSRKQDAATRFRNDPDILVLLLHGERQNAGLNVTCASRVFLLESVVHHSFEVQAIARIDRLGQLRPTEVYCYYAEDTVERNILDLAVRQGLSLYTADRARGTVDMTGLTPEGENSIVDAPAKKQQKGDFIFRMDDMMSILFPHLCEDVEFLLPPEDVDVETTGDDSLVVPAGASASSYDYATTSLPHNSSRRVYENAVAGPSRLG